MRVRSRVNVCRVDDLTGSLSATNYSQYCAKTEPKASAQQKEDHEECKSDPGDEFGDPRVAVFIEMGRAIDGAIRPVSFVP